MVVKQLSTSTPPSVQLVRRLTTAASAGALFIDHAGETGSNETKPLIKATTMARMNELGLLDIKPPWQWVCDFFLFPVAARCTPTGFLRERGDASARMACSPEGVRQKDRDKNAAGQVLSCYLLVRRDETAARMTKSLWLSSW
jgi:hypothetical protein